MAPHRPCTAYLEAPRLKHGGAGLIAPYLLLKVIF